MAEPDHRDGGRVTPNTERQDKPARQQQKPDEPGPAARGSSSSGRTRPVRKAPLRRPASRSATSRRRPPAGDQRGPHGPAAKPQPDGAAAPTTEPDLVSSATGDGVDDEWAVVDSGVGEPAETIESVALTSAEPPGETSPAEASTDDTSAAATDDVPQRDTVTIERDPSDVERTVSYRERRQARMASTRGADAAEKKQRIRYRGSSSRSARAIAFAAVAIFLTVAFVVAAVLFAVGVGRQNDLDAQRSEYSSFASQFIVNMTSMNPSTVDNVLKTVQQDSSGRAKQQLQDSTQQAVGLVRDTNVETKTTVLSAAVTKAERDEGSVIMVFGWQQKSLDGKSGSQVQTFRWRVDMTRINGALKVTDFEWVA